MVLVGFVRGGVGLRGDEAEVRGAVRGVRGVVVRVGAGVVVAVGDEAVFGALGGGRLLVVGVVARAAVPGADADVGLAVGEGADELLEQRVVFDGADALDVALAVGEDGALERFLGLVVGFVPGRAEVLHEQRVALAGGRLADLLDGYVAACADDVGDVEEVIPAETGEGDFCLFALMTMVKSDNSARGVGAGSDGRGVVRGDGDVVVVVEAVDLEGLGVAGLVVDMDSRHIRLVFKRL